MISDKLRRTFSNSIFTKVMKRSGGSDVVQFFLLFNMSDVVQFFRLLNMLTVGRCSETKRFRHLTNGIF